MRHRGNFLSIALALASSITLAGSFSAVSFAQGSDNASSSAAPKETKPPTQLMQKPIPEEPNKPPVDPLAERIRYLHDRLRITRAQEPLWDDVARVMRDNADAVAPLIKERVQNA